MRIITFAPFALLIVAACETETDRQLDSLRAELVRQQGEIDRLSAFVDAQAQVLTICQNAMVELTDYLINTNAIGMFREAGSQFAQLGECTDAIDHFNVIATAGGMAQSKPMTESNK